MLDAVPFSNNLFIASRHEDKYYENFFKDKINHVISITRQEFAVPAFYEYYNISVDFVHISEDIVKNPEALFISVCENVLSVYRK